MSVAARTAVEMGLFGYIAQQDGPSSCEELAAKSGGEELLISTLHESISISVWWNLLTTK